MSQEEKDKQFSTVEKAKREEDENQRLEEEKKRVEEYFKKKRPDVKNTKLTSRQEMIDDSIRLRKE